MDEAWQTEHFSSRHIGHGRKGKGTGGGGKGGSFDPRRTYGVYELKCTAFDRSSGKNNILEIHGPVQGRDDALMCSLQCGGVLEGVAVLAGSRKVLEEVVRGFDEEEEEDVEDDADDGDDDDGTGGEDESDDEEPKTSIELADEKERRRFAAFEKNSFRSPKFWLRWRGVVSSKEVDGQQQGTSVKKIVEVNGGYLVFGGNECANFQGTISCDALGWRNVKVTGAKVVSKARECPVGWNDVGLD